MSEQRRFEGQLLEGVIFRNCSMRQAEFEDISLADACYTDIDLRRTRFRNVNMTGVSIDDANINGLTVLGYDVQALIRDHEARIASANSSSDKAGSAVDMAIPSRTEAARPFLPSKDFDVSKAFYEAMGFPKLLDGNVAIFGVGTGAFILQRGYQKDWAENCMMQLMVDDLDAWWQRIEALDLPNSFEVPAPKAPVIQPWGLRVAYLIDPAGVLWHIAQRREDAPHD